MIFDRAALQADRIKETDSNLIHGLCISIVETNWRISLVIIDNGGSVPEEDFVEEREQQVHGVIQRSSIFFFLVFVILYQLKIDKLFTVGIRKPYMSGFWMVELGRFPNGPVFEWY